LGSKTGKAKEGLYRKAQTLRDTNRDLIAHQKCYLEEKRRKRDGAVTSLLTKQKFTDHRGAAAVWMSERG